MYRVTSDERPWTAAELRELILKAHDEARMAAYARKSHLQRYHGRECMALLERLLSATEPPRPVVPETAHHPEEPRGRSTW